MSQQRGTKQRMKWLPTVVACSIALGGASYAMAAQVPATPPAPPKAPQDTSINGPHMISTISSTIDPVNGDTNPYAVAINPANGALYVSNFSNSAGTNGAGTTIEKIVNGQPQTFFASATGPAAMAFSPKGPLWIANFGQWGTDGNVQVTKPTGASFGTDGLITNPAIQGPWGMAFAPSFTSADGTSSPPAFFVASALNGSIEAMYGFSPPNFNSDTKVLQIGSGLAHWGSNANNIVGPQGMAWDAMNDTLYVTDGADNSIRAYHWWGASTTDQGTGQVVYQGAPLNTPAGIAIDPLSGDLLVVNQGNNNIIELALPPVPPVPPTPMSAMTPVTPAANLASPAGAPPVATPPTPPMPMAHVVGQRVLDTGAAGALFGIAATTDASGNLVVYFTDDNTNTVNELTATP